MFENLIHVVTAYQPLSETVQWAEKIAFAGIESLLAVLSTVFAAYVIWIMLQKPLNEMQEKREEAQRGREIAVALWKERFDTFSELRAALRVIQSRDYLDEDRAVQIKNLGSMCVKIEKVSIKAKWLFADSPQIHKIADFILRVANTLFAKEQFTMKGELEVESPKTGETVSCIIAALEFEQILTDEVRKYLKQGQ